MKVNYIRLKTIFKRILTNTEACAIHNDDCDINRCASEFCIQRHIKHVTEEVDYHI